MKRSRHLSRCGWREDYFRTTRSPSTLTALCLEPRSITTEGRSLAALTDVFSRNVVLIVWTMRMCGRKLSGEAVSSRVPGLVFDGRCTAARLRVLSCGFLAMTRRIARDSYSAYPGHASSHLHEYQDQRTPTICGSNIPVVRCMKRDICAWIQRSIQMTYNDLGQRTGSGDWPQILNQDLHTNVGIHTQVKDLWRTGAH